MTLARAGELLRDANEHSRAVLACNVITLEQVEAVVEGVERAQTPVLLQVSENAIRFRRGFRPLLLACRALAEDSTQPVGIHLDHIVDEDLARALIADAAELGITSLMVDAAHLPDDVNTSRTAVIVAEGHRHGVWMEAELGAIGGKGTAHTPGVRTDPDEAREFVAATGVDSLAVAVGSVHAMKERTASLDIELIARIAATVPVPLVLHGSSGVPADVLRRAVRAGIRKVNVGTALGVVGTAQLRRELADAPNATDPRVYLEGTRAATAALVAEIASALT